MNAELKQKIIAQIIGSNDNEMLREIALMLEVDSEDLYPPLPKRFRSAINQSKEQFEYVDEVSPRPLIHRARRSFVKA